MFFWCFRGYEIGTLTGNRLIMCFAHIQHVDTWNYFLSRWSIGKKYIFLELCVALVLLLQFLWKYQKRTRCNIDQKVYLKNHKNIRQTLQQNDGNISAGWPHILGKFEIFELFLIFLMLENIFEKRNFEVPTWKYFDCLNVLF